MDDWRLGGRAGAVQASFEDLGTPLVATTFAVLDLETTGLSPDRDRITEIGVVKVRGGEVLGEFQCLVRPDVPIPPAVTALTGISAALVADRPPIEAALPALLEFLRGTVVVAHNAHFDTAFVRAACARAAYSPPDGPTVCTARLARRALGRGEVRNLRLETLAHHFRARVKPSHRALEDARATVDVLHGLLERVGSLGVATLEDLRDYTRSVSDPAYRKVGLVAGAPDAPGVYRFRARDGTVLYVGKATRLRERLRRYFGQDERRKVADLLRETEAVDWEVAPTELEAAVRELRAIHRLEPRYNRRSRGVARAVHVKLTREAYPRLSIVTSLRDDDVGTVGPLPSRRAAQAFVEAVHDTIPLRQCTDRLSPRRRTPACVLKEIGRCGAPCDDTQSPEEYAAVVARYTAAVGDDPGILLDGLREQMAAHAASARFEDAARARRRLHDVARTLLRARRLRTLSEVAELVASRRAADGSVEVALVQRGRLGATATLPRDATPADVDEVADRLATIAPPPPPPGVVPREDVEEVGLVADWLDDPSCRLVRADGGLAEPWSGGELLRTTLEEARRTNRLVRRDRAAMERRKVAARPQATGAPTGVRASTSSR